MSLMPPLARKTSAEFFRKSHITHQSSPADLEALKQHALDRIDHHKNTVRGAKNYFEIVLKTDSSPMKQELIEENKRQMADAEHRLNEWSVTYNLAEQAQAIHEKKASQSLNFRA